jgi:hypothetical protein
MMTEDTEDALKPFPDGRFWYDVPPAEAIKLYPEGIPKECAPLNDDGEPCPWPYDPEKLGGAPMGQYHCPYCGLMSLAGVKHLDARVLS